MLKLISADQEFWKLLFLWMLFVLVPMVPAITIYKLFPKDRVGVKGPLAGFRIKATGAFAAYIIAAFMPYFLIDNIREYVIEGTQQPYELKGRVSLSDQEPGEAPPGDVLLDLSVAIAPNILSTTKEGDIDVKLKNLSNPESWDLLQLEVDGYVPAQYTKDSLSSLMAQASGRVISLGTIVLDKKEDNYHAGVW